MSWRVRIVESMDKIPTPKEVAEALRATGMQKDEILDLLKATAETTGGWTDRLNKVGLHILKPDAPEGQEKAA